MVEVPEWLSPLFTAVISGSVALVTSLVLLSLQQAAARRERLRSRKSEAFERFLDLSRYAQSLLDLREPAAERLDRWKLLELGARFSVLTPGRDAWVAAWAIKCVTGVAERVAVDFATLKEAVPIPPWDPMKAAEHVSAEVQQTTKRAKDDLALVLDVVAKWSSEQLHWRWFRLQVTGEKRYLDRLIVRLSRRTP